MYVLSTGGGENSIFQWALVKEDKPTDSRLRGSGVAASGSGKDDYY
jgi:hypothetical protein